MKEFIPGSSNLDKDEKINIIKQNAPHILSFLKKNIDELDEEQLQSLYEFSAYENAAKKAGEKLLASLTEIVKSFYETIEKGIKDLKLSDKEKELINSDYKQILLVGINKASDSLYNGLQGGEGILYSALLSEKTVDVLNAILDFKKSIDKKFPGLTDTVLSVGAPVLVAAASAYYPPVGIALKATGILSKTASFLQTENLEKTITTMKASIAKINKDKELAELQETGVKITELDDKLNIEPDGLIKLKPRLNTVNEITQSPEENIELVPLIKEVANFSEKHIPSSEKDIDRRLQKIKDATLEQLEKDGVSKEIKADVTKILDKVIEKGKAEMMDTLKPNQEVLDNITSVQHTADILKKARNAITVKVGEKYPNNEKALVRASRVLKETVNLEIRGDTRPIREALMKNSQTKQFAKEKLGMGLKTN